MGREEGWLLRTVKSTTERKVQNIKERTRLWDKRGDGGMDAVGWGRGGCDGGG